MDEFVTRVTRRLTIIMSEHVEEWHGAEILRKAVELEDLILSYEEGRTLPWR